MAYKCYCGAIDDDVPELVLTLNDVHLEVVDNFTYFGSCITNNGGDDVEVNGCIRKARVAYAHLHHFWHLDTLSRYGR